MKYKKLLIDTFIFAVGGLGSKLVLFFLVPLYTNFMSKAEYGIADLVFTAEQLIIPFVSLVIYDAVIRFGLSAEKKEEVLKVGIYVLIFSIIVICIFSPMFSLYRPLMQWKSYLCIYLILNEWSEIQKNYLKVKDKNKNYAFNSVMQTLVLAIANVVMLTRLHLGIKGYLLANIFSVLFSVIYTGITAHVITDLKRACFNKELFCQMLIYSCPLILNNISWWIVQSSDKIMVEAMIDASALGIYTVATKIPSLINVMTSIFSQAWSISSIKEFDTTKDSDFYSTVFEYYYSFIFFACIIFVSFTKCFMKYYVSDEFREAWRYVPLLLVSASFAAISSFYGSLYGALKKSLNNMLTTLAGAISNVVVNFALIDKIGIWGAVLGTLVSYIILSQLRMVDVGRHITIKFNSIRYIINIVIILTQAVTVSNDRFSVLSSVLALLLFCILNGTILVKLVKKAIILIRIRKLGH